MLRPALALLALLTCTTPAFAQPISPEEQARIDKLVAETLEKTRTPSASIAIVRDGKLVLAKAYGKASETIPASNPALPYQIASNSKQFTAMALLLLEDEGKLDLDDKVSKYLPGISGGDQISLRQLLSHTSGLQDYWPQDFSFPAMARPTNAAADPRHLGQEAARLCTRHAVAIFEHRLCRCRSNRREGFRRAAFFLP